MKCTITLVIFFCSILSLRAESLPRVDSVLDTIPTSNSIDDSVRVQMEEQKKFLASKMAEANLTHFVIRVPDNKFGYTIFIDGQMYIEQKSIPGVSGNAGFSKKEDADLVAKLVIDKIRMGEMPPTISEDDLQKLNVVD